VAAAAAAVAAAAVTAVAAAVTVVAAEAPAAVEAAVAAAVTDRLKELGGNRSGLQVAGRLRKHLPIPQSVVWTISTSAVLLALAKTLPGTEPNHLPLCVASPTLPRCAMAIRDAVQALGIEVRVGLHTGECEVRGEDIGGIAVHIGARVSALAGPNEVLVSSTLRDLVIGSGLQFDDRGAHELKGVPGEWHLFAV
jgi:hypothetical protein